MDATDPPPARAFGPLLQRHWPALLLASTSLVLQTFDLVDALRYQRELLPTQPWRLLSGNLVHLGWSHLWLNLAGLALIQALFGAHLRLRDWWLTLVAASAAVGAGLAFWHPQLDWYVGLSGSLHGLFAAGLLLDLRRPGWSGALLALGLVVKLGWEQLHGALPGSESAAGGTVLVDAHLYGAVAGVACGALWWWLAARRSQPEPVQADSRTDAPTPRSR